MPMPTPESIYTTTTDREALLALFRTTDGPNWANNRGWLNDDPINEWHGVTTDKDGRVTELNLSRNRLSGIIPASLGNLKELQRLDLSGNQLKEEIPPELGSLTNLTYLHLGSNMLRGQIPSELGYLSGLEHLFFSGNRLTGCMPPELWDIKFNELVWLGFPFCGSTNADSLDWAVLLALYNATDGPNWDNNTNWLSDRPLGEWYGVTIDANGRVTELALTNNGLAGELPYGMGVLDRLTRLSLAGNELTGNIPGDLGGLPNLEDLSLGGSHRTGCIPAALQYIANSDLDNIDLAYCVVSASSDRDALIAFYNATDGPNWEINTNWLSNKAIGEWYGVITGTDGRITAIDLSDNGLNGELPEQLSSLSGLRSLWLGHNRLTGGIPAGLGSLLNLQSLSLVSNRLSGKIPAQLGNIANMRNLFLQDNRLEGKIPAELGKLFNLQSLHLGFNRLRGEIPKELASLINLAYLHLGFNELSDGIPGEFGELSNLAYLHLGSNELSDEIPEKLGGLSGLQYLLLGGNRFTGCIPARLVAPPINDLDDPSMPQCRNTLDRATLIAIYHATDGPNWEINTNWLSEKAIGEWHGVSTDAGGRVTTLELVGNKLSDEIPVELVNLVNLEKLNLAGNQFNGDIPEELGNLPNLKELSLNSNELRGEIPASLAKLANLQDLSLGYNQLSGRFRQNLAICRSWRS